MVWRLYVKGETMGSSALVVATGVQSASRLLPKLPSPQVLSTTCLNFLAACPPIEEPILVLNGARDGPINNLVFPTQVAPS